MKLKPLKIAVKLYLRSISMAGCYDGPRGRLEMKTEYRLILKKNLDEILEDTIEIEDASIMSMPNAKEFEKKIRDYIRGLNP